VIEATICFDVACKRGYEGLSRRGDPVDDDTFEAFGVVRSGTRDTLLNLFDGHWSWLYCGGMYRTYQVSNNANFLIGTGEKAGL
jgi:hypothetical protein